MWKKSIIFIFMILVICIPVFAGDDYFYIKSTGSSYEVVPGEEFVIDFVLFNKDVEAPKNVTAYIDPCPYGWECEQKVFSYEKQAEHPENLTVKVYDKALPKRETIYVRLESYWPTKRGDDRVLVTVLENKVKTISYEEYKEKEEEKEEKPSGVYIPVSQSGAEIVEVKEAEPEEIKEELEEEKEQKEETGKEEEPEPEKVVEKIERLESDKGFMEYATVVLVILLTVTGIGAFIAWKKK